MAASTNGLVVSMDEAMALANGNMLPYLHFTPGDMLWFPGWVPQSNGAMVGTCIGLLLLALVERWLAAMRAMAEVAWRKQADIAFMNAQNADLKASVPKPATIIQAITLRTIPPFIPAQGITRGIFQTAQGTLTFAFMLTVMTNQVSFIMSLVIGFGVGEIFFGRYISAGSFARM